MSATADVSKVSTSVWTIDPAHTIAEFKVKHMMISNVKGRFSGVAGEVVFDEADVTNSRVIATLDAASINTGDPQRDAHLKSADFLDVDHFPNLSFRSSRIVRRGDGVLALEGELTIHGVTKTVVFTVKDRQRPAKIHGAKGGLAHPQPRRSIVKISALSGTLLLKRAGS
jgi:polyisoprenoid-binding protein YceI